MPLQCRGKQKWDLVSFDLGPKGKRNHSRLIPSWFRQYIGSNLEGQALDMTWAMRPCISISSLPCTARTTWLLAISTLPLSELGPRLKFRDWHIRSIFGMLYQMMSHQLLAVQESPGWEEQGTQVGMSSICRLSTEISRLPSACHSEVLSARLLQHTCICRTEGGECTSDGASGWQTASTHEGLCMAASHRTPGQWSGQWPQDSLASLS